MSETYIDIMIQSLQKKEQILSKIIKLNDEQKMALEDENIGPDKFDETVEDKAKLIEQLELLDTGFEKLFENVKEELNNNKEKYATKIRKIQSLIRNITDKSVEIQAGEARNKTLMEAKFSRIKGQARQVRMGENAASKYYKMMSNVNLVDPQFMDDKH